jgi:hypothetical protein
VDFGRDAMIVRSDFPEIFLRASTTEYLCTGAPAQTFLHPRLGVALAFWLARLLMYADSGAKLLPFIKLETRAAHLCPRL